MAGIPARLEIPALGVNAAFQTIGLDTSAPADAQGRRPLGNPSDRTQAGWFSAGPQPGSGTGTVLVNGHTYHDGSAIFKESFASQIANGQRIDIVQGNGTVCSYQVQRVWRDVAKSDYPTIVSSQGLYNVSGPERLFLATCGGPFNSSEQNYDAISMLIATPIDRS
ncbi:MAG: class F sortase [Terracoccus sp.]